jgi:hypothetical protein
MILVIGNHDDAHVRIVLRRLAEKGAEAVGFDAAEAPAACGLSGWIDGTGAPRARIRRPSGDIDVTRARTVWLRRLSDFTASAELAPEDQEFVLKETRAFGYSLAATLIDRFWVNPLIESLATDRGNGKLSQLEHARRIGMIIPRTLATNDPDMAREFVRSCPDGAIYKPFFAPTRNVGRDGEPEQWASVFTSRVDARALDKLDGVRHAPCIFQELVAKRLELRVAVIGHKVFAAEIHSQVGAPSALDIRRPHPLGETPYFPHELPSAVVEHCLALNRALGLVFGAYDFVLTPDGRYVFLEVNQQGQFLWLEELTGLPLLENFCELLIQATPDYHCDAAPHAPGPFAALPPLAPAAP